MVNFSRPVEMSTTETQTSERTGSEGETTVEQAVRKPTRAPSGGFSQAPQHGQPWAGEKRCGPCSPPSLGSRAPILESGGARQAVGVGCGVTGDAGEREEGLQSILPVGDEGHADRTGQLERGALGRGLSWGLWGLRLWAQRRGEGPLRLWRRPGWFCSSL